MTGQIKRSEVNRIMREADTFIRSFGYILPPFAYWSPKEFKDRKADAKMIVDAKPALEAGEKMQLAYNVRNTQRPIGTKLSSSLTRRFGMKGLAPGQVTIRLRGTAGQSLGAFAVQGIKIEVFEIPGHSPGHVVFVHRGNPAIVLGGDVLFQGSVGRTDFPGGSAKRLFDGIRRKLFTLPDDTVVYSGHGPATTIGHEKRTNPFVGQLAD